MAILDWYNPAIRLYIYINIQQIQKFTSIFKITDFENHQVFKDFFPLKFLNRFELLITTIYINPLSTRLRVGWVNNHKTQQFQTRSMWMVKAMCFSSAEASMSLNSSNSAPGDRCIRQNPSQRKHGNKRPFFGWNTDSKRDPTQTFHTSLWKV